MDGDGLSDLVIGATYAAGGAGAAVLAFGSSDPGQLGSEQVTFAGEASADAFGWSVW